MVFVWYLFLLSDIIDITVKMKEKMMKKIGKNKRMIIILIEIIILGLIYLICNSKFVELIPSCFIYDNTGILCPSCGGTRCIINLFQGHFFEAFLYHLIFFIIIVYLFIFNIIYLVNINRKEKIAKWIYPKPWMVICFTVLLVIYTIIRNML